MKFYLKSREELWNFRMRNLWQSYSKNLNKYGFENNFIGLSK